MRYSLILIFIGISSARADTVYLTNGNTLEGRVRFENDKVIIEQSAGEVILDKSKVEHVEKSKTALDDFDERLKALEQKERPTADDYAGLAQFAASRKLKNHAEQAWTKALEIDPAYEAAHNALGHVKYQGNWMSSDEANRSRGLVRHEGAWITPEAQADLHRMQAEANADRVRAEENDRRQERAQRDAIEEERERIQPRYNPYPYVFYSRSKRFRGHGKGSYHRDENRSVSPAEALPKPAPYPPPGHKPPAPYKPSGDFMKYDLFKK